MPKIRKQETAVCTGLKAQQGRPKVDPGTIGPHKGIMGQRHPEIKGPGPIGHIKGAWAHGLMHLWAHGPLGP